MIDRTIPFYPIMMIKEDMDVFPDCALHPDYEFSFYTPETGREDWIHVQYLSGQIENKDEIGGLFDDEFKTDPELLPNQMLFVRDKKTNEPVASAALWYGNPFGYKQMRIHWVATHLDHQGKGLCRAMLSRLMKRYHELDMTGDVFLFSQTYSYAAISIYQDFGFKRYIGEEPVNWRVNDYDESQKKAWALIDEKISAYKSKKHP